MIITLPKQVHTVLTLLNEAGFEAYVVGGSVRDHILGKACNDWDICTSATSQETEVIFRDYRLIETGLKHGTVTVLIDNEPIEITEYRCGNSLYDDLGHRDFTVDAIAYHPDKGIIDPFGGQEDVLRRLIRCVGAPDDRFLEDPLRILRAMRLASTFDMEIDPDTAEAMKRNCEKLSVTAAERIRTELEKMLCGKAAYRILRDYAGILAKVIPEIRPSFGFEQHSVYHDSDVWEHTLRTVDAISPEPVFRWTMLLHDIGKPEVFRLDERGAGHFYGHASLSAEKADAIMQRLKFDNATRDDVIFLIRHHMDQIKNEDTYLKRTLRRFGEERLRQLIQIFRADTYAQSSKCLDRLRLFDELEESVDRIVDEAGCLSLSGLAVNGHDMQALGLQGREIGMALDELLDAVICGEAENDREALIGYFRAHYMK